MSPPTLRVNAFVQDDLKLQVDPISKMFIVMESILGLDRLPLLSRGKFTYVLTTFVVFLTMNGAILYKNIPRMSIVVVYAPFVQNIICSLLSYARCKWMQSFYGELIKFDTSASCTPKASLAGIRNIFLCFLWCIFVILLFVLPKAIGFYDRSPLHHIPTYLVYVLEVYYFGHLLGLLIPRLKLINFYLESSLSCTSTEMNHIIKGYIYFKCYDPKVAQNNMKKLMDLYEIVVDAYDCLIEGIKWQLLSVIISTFVSVLAFLYSFTLHAVRDDGVFRKQALYELGVPIVLLTPLFSPCIFGDSVHREVRKLRELLASRLYENKLDKAGRRTARALLAFTEIRDLSFRLLRMLNIDISLPFKFVGLLVTYLIILLQFRKVINT